MPATRTHTTTIRTAIPTHMSDAAHHAAYEAGPGDPRPSLEHSVARDAKSGFNVHLITNDFRFTPENASQDAVPGTGHAHIYVDGVKLGRVYTPWYHLDGLAPGDHVVKVDLNANDHRPYSVDGVAVADEVTVTVPEPKAGHMHPISHEPAQAMSLVIEAAPDPKNGFNVRLQYAGFVFAPEHASSPHVDGEGHAHLYVDGVKLTRLYGDWYHVPLAPGEHELRVTLNGNDHGEYVLHGIKIQDTVTVRA